jgi:V/A-type H+-transporting ATPase subunit I
MIIPLKKYLFFGIQEDLDHFFERAQNQGYIEFIHPSGKKPVETPTEVQTIVSAIKTLRKLPVKKPYLGGGESAYAVEIASRILVLKGEIERLSEEARILEAEIVRVAPFGDFSMEDIEYIEREGNRKIQFFCVKTAKGHRMNLGDEVIYVNTVYDLDYFITINKEVTHYPDMIEMRVDRSARELEAQLALVKESLHLLEIELKGFAGHIDFLRHVLVELLNDFHLAAAKKETQAPLGSSIFSIEAWIPENKVTAVFGMVDGMAILAENIAVEPEEKVPTYMENKGPNRIGEDLVKVYDIPSPNDKDPSGWVLWSFVLFFAMIVSDGGYGLVFLALAFFLKTKFPQVKGITKRLFKLTFILAAACIVWGILTSSYFGVNFNPQSPIVKFSPITYLVKKKAAYHISKQDEVQKEWVQKYPEVAEVSDPEEFIMKTSEIKEGKLVYDAFDEYKDSIFLELSLLIGVIHVSISLLRYLFRNLAGLGWLLFLIGGYLYFPFVLQATSMLHYLGIIDPDVAAKIGLQMIYGGIGLAVVLALIQKRLKGLAEITVIIQVFSDVLSYIRLYALSLAGAMLASTFNDLGSTIGLAAGVLIILLGHLVNIQLGLMAGVIHGLRLNFLEWYHYSFEGGGKLFNPLKKMKP